MWDLLKNGLNNGWVKKSLIRKENDDFTSYTTAHEDTSNSLILTIDQTERAKCEVIKIWGSIVKLFELRRQSGSQPKKKKRAKIFAFLPKYYLYLVRLFRLLSWSFGVIFGNIKFLFFFISLLFYFSLFQTLLKTSNFKCQ